MSQGLLIGVAVALLLAASGWTYNRLVFNRQRVAAAWSGIDVQLKRRADLVPSLVSCVQGYMLHERTTLQALTAERGQAVGLAQAPLSQRAPVESQLASSLGQVLALAEGYPQLQADRLFIDLQVNLRDCEEHLQMARRYYNGAVRELNVLVESVPSNLLARLFGFVSGEYFAVNDRAERQAPNTEF